MRRSTRFIRFGKFIVLGALGLLGLLGVVVILGLIGLFVAVAVSAEAAERTLTPTASSPTAMVKCGAVLGEVKTKIGATRQYVFTGQETLTGMRYCIPKTATEAAHDLVDARNTYRVPKGTVGWLTPDGRVVLEGCVNDATCKGCALPVPLAAVVPPTPPPPVPVVAAPSECPGGWRLTANVWSSASLPPTIQEEAKHHVEVAESRESNNAADASSYRADDVSRTMGARLRKEVRVRAPIGMNLRVFYRDTRTAEVLDSLGTLRVEAGTGTFRFSGDPRKWIVEIVWPGSFISPTESGGERRLWLFPEEWGRWCKMNVHGIVP